MSDELLRALGNLEGKVDLLLEQAKQTNAHTEKLTERVSKLEHESTATKTLLAAGAAVAASVGGIAGAFADRLLK